MMILVPLLACFWSFVASGTVMARFYGHRGSVILSMIALAVSLVWSSIVWLEAVWGCSECSQDLFGVWFEVGSFAVGWSLSGDLLTCSMVFTVTSVSLAVHSYAVVYMRGDPHLSLFMSYLSLFTFFMLVLVTADSLVVMLVGWEGIGVCSYLLIGYWSHRLSAVKSAGKAILVNRISDGLLMWGVVWIWYGVGGSEYDLVCLPSGYPGLGEGSAALSASLPGLVLVSVLVGAMGKSAQILFHVWLADAMEGPTPVSALIHAATLVTAGVYLMVRLAPFWDSLVLFVGSVTAFMASVFGFFQNDLKRVIAFSTCSQLGYMMVSVGLGELGAEASMSHLMTHASFKAALFLSAGLIIGVSSSHQHTARYGSLSGVHTSLFCFTGLVLASLSLVGWPELSGFYSKETILNLAGLHHHTVGDVAHTILLLTAFLTSCYSAKLLIGSFIMNYSGGVAAPNIATHGPGGSAAKGYSAATIIPILATTLLLLDILNKVWVGTNLVNGIVPFIPWGTKTLPLGLVVTAAFSALAGTTIWLNSLTLVRLCGTRWGFDQMFARLMVNGTFDWARLSYRGITGGLNHTPYA